jgi:hypothetical protein
MLAQRQNVRVQHRRSLDGRPLAFRSCTHTSNNSVLHVRLQGKVEICNQRVQTFEPDPEDRAKDINHASSYRSLSHKLAEVSDLVVKGKNWAATSSQDQEREQPMLSSNLDLAGESPFEEERDYTNERFVEVVSATIAAKGASRMCLCQTQLRCIAHGCPLECLNRACRHSNTERTCIVRICHHDTMSCARTVSGYPP